ncbi:plasmid stabilization protein [Cohnella kolymensis]|uniref:Plasmid stabilization protein n=1 Tax=Cohnella kolymensis TaxID=1590652 RepID=A0ABR5A7E5_9BACL|nr:type II toxin-antitoxin system RelE/ParE family toxin [Cohnella kolymensis]KIL36327.1 plasmid stabilization protein [Cohnella kolymensis]
MLPILVLGPAEHFLKKVVEKPLKTTLLQAMQEIRMDPYIGEAKTGDLAGYYCYDVFYKGTNYELAYTLEENQDGELLVVILAGTRENFYEELKRIVKRRLK